MKVYFVRHGKTEYNIKKMIQGDRDIPLSDVGREEIRKFKNEVDKLEFDVCICSPFDRAKETAKILVGDRTNIIVNDYLKERHVGKLEGTSTDNYDVHKYWNINYEKDELDIETPKEVLERARRFIEYIKENYKDETILVVDHDGIIKAIHYVIVGYDDNTDLTSFYCEHNKIYEYEIV